MSDKICISMIVALHAETNLIGEGNQLLWHIPEDLKFFKEKTSGHAIIMGRKTFYSIGGALPNRENFLLTRGFPELIDHDEDKIFRNFDDGLEAAKHYSIENNLNEIFIIGGGEVYKQSMDRADKLYVTEVDMDIDLEIYAEEDIDDEQDDEEENEENEEEENEDEDIEEIIRGVRFPEITDEWEGNFGDWTDGIDKKTGEKIRYRFIEYTREN